MFCNVQIAPTPWMHACLPPRLILPFLLLSLQCCRNQSPFMTATVVHTIIRGSTNHLIPDVSSSSPSSKVAVGKLYVNELKISTKKVSYLKWGSSLVNGIEGKHPVRVMVTFTRNPTAGGMRKWRLLSMVRLPQKNTYMIHLYLWAIGRKNIKRRGWEKEPTKRVHFTFYNLIILRIFGVCWMMHWDIMMRIRIRFVLRCWCFWGTN